MVGCNWKWHDWAETAREFKNNWGQNTATNKKDAKLENPMTEWCAGVSDKKS